MLIKENVNNAKQQKEAITKVQEDWNSGEEGRQKVLQFIFQFENISKQKISYKKTSSFY